MIEIPDLKGKPLFDWLLANKSTLIAQKKFELKRGDAISYAGSIETYSGKVVKANEPANDNRTELAITSIINTTYWYDSHGDVHIDGLWKKSLSENRQLYLLQEHSMSFKGIIADEVKGYTKRISWRSLGVDFDGYTEALVFESTVKQDRNPYMFDEYRKGHVKNHSVGMRYVDIDLAFNSDEDDYSKYKERWDKYIDKIANKAEVEAAGYFFAVKEAKAVEGSAVPVGSNIITPTQSVKNTGPAKATHPRAAKRTQVTSELNKLLQLTKSVTR